MTRAERASRIARVLDRMFPKPVGPLADSDGDRYRLLIKVLLSAQCTDARVNQVAPALFRRAATPEAMTQLPVSAIEQVIRPCGLAPSKAASISGLSEQLLERHDGDVPASFAELEALPGVGHKTASVVLAQGFGLPAFPVDTHIHRLAGRWQLSKARNVKQTEADLKKLFARQHWHKVHLQFIFFGREHCPARGHDMSACPICSWAATKQAIRASQPSRPRGRATRAQPT